MSAVGHLAAHYERRRDESGTYIKFSNQNIDPEHTPENYNLAPEREGGQIEYLHRRLSQCKVQNRTDVNVLCSWVVTLPKEDYTPKQQKDFFLESYNFLSAKYGERNVVSSYVHLDENQPHMHFAFIPAVPDKKWNEKHPEAHREKVSAKECVTKAALQNFHVDLQQYLDSHTEIDLFPILNGATERGNLAITELKAISETQALCDQISMLEQDEFALTQEVEKRAYEASEARKTVSRLEGDIGALVNGKSVLEREINALQTKKEHLTTSEIESIKGQKTFSGGLKGVSFKEWEQVKSTAAKVDSMTEERNAAITKVANAEREASEIKAKAFQLVEQVQQDRPSLKAQQEIIQLRRENDSLKKSFETLKSIFKAVLQYISRVSPKLYEVIDTNFLSTLRNPQQYDEQELER